MTTIAFRHETLAADSGVSFESRGCFIASTTKIYRGTGVMGAIACSRAKDAAAFRRWIEGGAKADKRPYSDEAQGIIVRSEPTSLELDVTIYTDGEEIAARGEFFACGSGAAMAIGAMAAGASAEAAVQIACEHDLMTRGPVQSCTPHHKGS